VFQLDQIREQAAAFLEEHGEESVQALLSRARAARRAGDEAAAETWLDMAAIAALLNERRWTAS
jgi:uncharacterized protein HemY